ncbi:hypothetical protein SAMN04487968_101279 [Nocardioides terrae]|uniref:Trypsin n=1 Tax=Nocardioides terrae TaxID=574651 RepID=A0A1I1DI52_9ACTN|nr:hypothetical protein [Nocardioides terrae]SFB74625.1 hypothetical protein SAMN04487968_101279 [Nocardioides terrae]
MKLSRTATKAATLTITLMLAAITALVLVAPRSSSASPGWAPAGSAAITPGVQMYTAGAQCTANFVYTDAAGDVYVGYAAHCAGLGEATDTDGCQAGSLPLGTPVTFNTGGSLVDEGTVVGHGTLAYSSWIRMHELGTSDAETCAYNDLALVRVDAADVGKVNPSVPFFGGPTGIDTDGTAAGDRLYSYGNSSLRGGLSVLSPKLGASLGDAAADEGWSHPAYTLTPGIPGDSGSGFMSAGGKAVGVLSTLGLAPLPLSNNIGDLGRELAFAQQHSGIAGLGLVNGTEPFHAVL